jgi:uncharacterized protein
MSQANIATVQSMYAAFGKGDIATIIGGLTSDIDWTCNGRPTDFPTFGNFKGQPRVGDFFKTVGEHLKFSVFSPDEFYADGDKVIVLGHYAMAMSKTGKTMASDWCHIFTFKNGKVAKFKEFLDTAQAAEAYRG